MNTIKIKIKKTETKEIEKEISLPYYSKNNCYAYKVVSEKQFVQVNYSDCIKSIQANNDICLSFPFDGTEEISEYEFENIYANVLQEIKSLRHG